MIVYTIVEVLDQCKATNVQQDGIGSWIDHCMIKPLKRMFEITQNKP